MSVEVIHHPVANGEIIELFGTEALIRRRKALQGELGTLSVALNDISRQYNDCIRAIIETNAALAIAEDVDTQALARELQADVQHPASL
ncbi:MAG: hypothetical protein JWM00_740 [Candidatus Saccharibacteria bacterium]|nr:hypothetical protein [Candidatus Saccharibacteria bacterium]